MAAIDYPQLTALFTAGHVELVEGNTVPRDALLLSLVPMIRSGCYLEDYTDRPGPLNIEGNPFPALAVFESPELAAELRLPLALPMCVREYEATEPGDMYPLRWTSAGVDRVEQILRGSSTATDCLDNMFPVCLIRDQFGGVEETLERAQEKWRGSPLSKTVRSKDGKRLRVGVAVFARLRSDRKGLGTVTCWLLRRKQLEEDAEIWSALCAEQKRSPMNVLLFRAETEVACEAVGRVLEVQGIRYMIEEAESAYGLLGAAMSAMGRGMSGFALSVPEPDFKRAEAAIVSAGFNRNA